MSRIAQFRSYRLEGEGESGEKYHLPTSVFGPYNFEMQLVGFSYLAQEQPLLRGIWGSISKGIDVTRVYSITTKEEAFAYESEHASILYNPKRTERTRVFLQRFFENLNQRGSRKSGLSILRAPPVLWLSSTQSDYAEQEPIKWVRVFHVFSLWDGDALRVIRELPIMEVQLPM